MKTKLLNLSGLLLIVFLLSSCGSKYTYEIIKDDPTATRIYTLKNGLKVYLSVNKANPRIQTTIAVNVGGKNDPAETTGLAHYFEHLMFKGTQSLGTVNYQEEKVYLEKIEERFEVYRKTTDPIERKLIYAQIDSLSQIACKYAIPNEYVKAMSIIGAQGSNAYTSNDVTAYIEDIPANQIENWAKIQTDRFRNNVIRLFHTELETVYEEYNMSLTDDVEKVIDTIFSALFPNHPYGTQTILGTAEQLKNPSITNIKKFYSTYYVPNNMAICMSGDFDPDQVIEIVDKYFGTMEAKPLPEFKFKAETPLAQNINISTIGLEPEFVTIAYRTPGGSHQDAEISDIVSSILTNGKCGLLDLNLNQKQTVLNASAWSYILADYGLFILEAKPKAGQTLEQVRDSLLQQVELLKSGNFDESMVQSIVDNYIVNKNKARRHNRSRVNDMVNAFNFHKPWEQQISFFERLGKLSKQQIIDFANTYLNYAVIVNKKEGSPILQKIEKPQITPIAINRDTSSVFLKEISDAKPKDMAAVFINYQTDMSIKNLNSDVKVLYKKNTEDPVFSMMYILDRGSNSDKELELAFKYLPYLGTHKYTPEELQNKWYKLALQFHAIPTRDKVYVTLSGLEKNFNEGIQLLEEVLSSVQPNKLIYDNLVEDILKERQDAKLEQYTNFSRLISYIRYGKDNPATHILTEKQLKELNPSVLTNKINNLFKHPHIITYYGPNSEKDFLKELKKYHILPNQMTALAQETIFAQTPTNQPKIYLAQYQANQIYYGMNSLGVNFSKELQPTIDMYNKYFGNNMSSIVFQEMRESRALAYSAYMNYTSPLKPDMKYSIYAFIATQNDKMKDAINAFDNIINQMPLSQKTFESSKESLLNAIRTQRIIRDDIFWSYLDDSRYGYTEDSRKLAYEKISTLTLKDIQAFQEKYVKNQVFHFGILGNVKDLDQTFLKTKGEVIELTQEDIFGY